MDKPINHQEAFELACLKRNESNLARCYLDLVNKLKRVPDRDVMDIDNRQLYDAVISARLIGLKYICESLPVNDHG